MKVFAGFLILWKLHLMKCFEVSEDYIARVEEGFVRGTKETSMLGKEFYSFLSLPYAKPPVGDLRFTDPIGIEPWDGILNATSKPDFCLQYQFLDNAKEDKSKLIPIGKEDCLYLNVYTPKPKNPHAKLPVMVFIHGGGFMSGGAQEYQPYVLLNEEIVLVVLQYRLGIFGFLSTEDSVLPGNMGLKDQQLALKWVQNNILHFGGDPDKVTIFGESAGGASVHMHILSPGSKGLFNRAILQSGTALCPWAISENHKEFAEKAGNKFQCSLKDGTKSYIKCMQRIDAKLLLLHFVGSFKWGVSPLIMVPRVDGNFLPDRPEILLKNGKYHKVDMLMGITRDEGALISLIICDNPKMLESLNSNFKEVGPLSLFLENESESEKLATEIYKYYLQRKIINITSAHDEQLKKIYDDSCLGICHDLTSLFHANDDEISVYLYQLDHVGQRSFADLFPNCDRNNWISHCDDLFYLFSGGPYFFQPLERKEDLKVRNIMVSLWTNFAKTGNPTSLGSDFIWERATFRNFKHLSLLSEPRMATDQRREVRRFWLSMKIGQFLNIVPDERLNPLDVENVKFETKEKREL